MSDEKVMQELNEVFNTACYGHFKEFTDKLGEIDEIDELLEAIEPHHLNEIISNSVQSMTCLLVELSDRCDSNSGIGMSRLKYRKEIKGILNCNFNQLHSRLNGFDEKLSLFRMRLQSWQDESSSEAFEGAFLGALLGGMLAGPFGAGFGAAFLGGGDSSADTDCKRELTSLTSQYQAILSELEKCLDSCFEDSGECFMEILKNLPDQDDVKLLDE